MNHIIYADAPNGSDDTVALQAKLDAGAGKHVYVPAGAYNVNAVTGLALKSNTILEFAPGAELKVVPNGQASYNLLKLTDVSNVTIRGGLFTGDRNQHNGTAGEAGYGINIRGGADIHLEGVTCKDFWGDGIFIWRGTSIPERISLTDCRCDNNRRQGMSVLAAKYLNVARSYFLNSNGIAPQTGVDLEPGNVNDSVQYVHFADSVFSGNAHGGLVLFGLAGLIQYVRAARCVFADNTKVGFGVTYATHVYLTDCDAVNNQTNYLASEVNGYLLTGCTP